MKYFSLLVFVLCAMFMFACQSTADEFVILDNGTVISNGNKKLSHKPTGVEYVKIEKQSVKIDFGHDEMIAEAISNKSTYYDFNKSQVVNGNIFNAFPTFGKLIDYYDKCQLVYSLGYESLRSPFDGEVLYPPVEYALAQECFNDDCPAETRKVVLRIALEKHKRKTGELYLISHASRRTGLFLMAVILVKEADAGFLTAICENPKAQNVLSLNLDTESQLNILNAENEIDSIVCQFSEKFLSKQIK